MVEKVELSGFQKNYRVDNVWHVAVLTVAEVEAVKAKHIADCKELMSYITADIYPLERNKDMAIAIFDKVADAAFTRISCALDSKIRSLRSTPAPSSSETFGSYIDALDYSDYRLGSK